MRAKLNENFYKTHSYTHRYDEFATQIWTVTLTNRKEPDGEPVYKLAIPHLTLYATKNEFDTLP